jgi:hypothetical protein
MTKRQKIAAEFVRLLSAITVGTYKTAFPTAKHWSTNIEPKENELFVNVKDKAETYSETADGLTKFMVVDIYLGCSKTGTNYATITNMIDDVLKCVYTNMCTLQISLNIIDIVPISAEPEVDLFEREVGAAKVSFRLTLEQHAVWLYDSTTY